MGSIYAFTSKSKPWVKLGMTVNSPIGRIEDYNSTHGTDFDVDSLREWVVPDCVCLYIEQAVHKELEANDFDRVRKGSANEIFTYAGRQHVDFVQVISATVLQLLECFSAEFSFAIGRLSAADHCDQIQDEIEDDSAADASYTTSDHGEEVVDGKLLEEKLSSNSANKEFWRPQLIRTDWRGWGVFCCRTCFSYLAAPTKKHLKVLCPKCHDMFYAYLSK